MITITKGREKGRGREKPGGGENPPSNQGKLNTPTPPQGGKIKFWVKNKKTLLNRGRAPTFQQIKINACWSKGKGGFCFRGEGHV